MPGDPVSKTGTLKEVLQHPVKRKWINISDGSRLEPRCSAFLEGGETFGDIIFE